MIHILFLLNSLHQGGAERQLVTLLEELDKSRFQPIVVTYYPDGKWEESVQAMEGVHYFCLNLANRFDLPGMLFRLAKIIRSTDPAIVYGLLGDACLLALLHGRTLGHRKVIWGLRSTNMDFSQYSLSSGWIYRLNAYLSKRVDRIIANSWTGSKYHVGQGYARDRIVVICNGIDTEHFRPQPEKGADLKQTWGVGHEIPLIGRVGRLDPMKDYPTFLKAAAILTGRRPDVRFVIVGGGPDQMLNDLKALSDSLGLDERVLWLGPREDLPAIYSACAFTSSSSSFGEGFPNVVAESLACPNVVAESLACEVPCVATDVGDSARVVGPGGIIVPAKNPAILAEAWEQILSMPQEKRRQMGQQGRKHIVKNFSTQQMVHATEKIFLDVVEHQL
jgi:glycosyltransferase involved in cell wall biosynthesis